MTAITLGATRRILEAEIEAAVKLAIDRHPQRHALDHAVTSNVIAALGPLLTLADTALVDADSIIKLLGSEPALVTRMQYDPAFAMLANMLISVKRENERLMLGERART